LGSLQVAEAGFKTQLFVALSTAEFRPFGQSVPGVPLFYNDRTMELLELPTRWMFYLALERGRTQSPKSWRAYAEQLLDWLRHCDANGWDLIGVKDGHLGAFRRHMLTSRSVFGQPYAPTTINARLNTVARFYEWLHRSRIINEFPFALEEARVSHKDIGLTGFARRTFTRRSGNLSVRKKIPKALPVELVRQVRTRLDQRDLLIVDWALTTGMRQDEILSLDLSQMPRVGPGFHASKVEFVITKTKYRVPRNVRVPVRLIDRTWMYVNTERARVLREAGAMTDAVFVSELGRRLSSKTIWKHYHAAVASCGAKHKFHALRDTFAIHRLLELQRVKDSGVAGSDRVVPILVLKEDLGHKDISTVQIYLQSLEQDTSQIEDSLRTLLDEVADA
jgi:site-specific recombinase XerD